MKIKELFGITSYYWYGNGGHFRSAQMPLTISGKDLVNASGQRVCTIEATSAFKLNRAFVDNWIVVRETQPPFTLSTNPTEQNFYFDEYFKLYKANGIANIWSATGCFDWYRPFMTGSQRKSACYDPRLSPLDPSAWYDLAFLCMNIAERYKTNGLVDFIQPLNEFDFRWNVDHVLTPEEYAVCFYECYKAIRSVSATQKILMGSTINPTMATFKRFVDHLDSITSTPIRDFYLDFHWYFRDGSSNQGGGTSGITPEDAKIYEFGMQMDNLCETEGFLGWMCSETGYATDNSKQHAPDLEGFTRLEAQGILMIRTILNWASCKYFKGATFWHCRDLYDSEPYAYAGINNKNWTPKPARTVCEDFLAKYGEYEVDSFVTLSNPTVWGYAASLTSSENSKALWWTNDKNISTLTPMPTAGDGVIHPEPTKPTVEVNVVGDLSKVNITIQ